MELALYDPHVGYYARSVQRSGRAGDFFTSVDVGALFGALLAEQVAEMAGHLAADRFELVEAGAGNGRLSADVLHALQGRHPQVYERVQLYLAERSPIARQAQRATLGRAADKLISSADLLPARFEGVLFANELLDALPVHQVVQRTGGLREIYVTAEAGRLRTIEGPLSDPRLAAYLARVDAALEPGWTAEINLNAVEWVRDAARRLTRGFIILIDYGHDARELYSASHSAGTLTTFAAQTMEGPETGAARPPWLNNPGERDITSHVDLTSVVRAAETEGLTTLGVLDQTYFLMGLLTAWPDALAAANVKTRLALKTLLLPGGLGSTMKVLLFGKGVGTPALRGLSYRVRVT
jgi:SAM-dependent MidA family methyltransferase